MKEQVAGWAVHLDRLPEKSCFAQQFCTVQLSIDMSASHSDLATFVQSLGITAREAQLLMQLADEATARFPSDVEATIWFESQVRRRHPDLWLLLQANSAPRTVPH